MAAGATTLSPAPRATTSSTAARATTRSSAAPATTTCFGGKGDDTLSGGEGDDVLRGGHGNDLFLFNGGGGNDLILDFEEGSDLVRIAKGINGLDVNSAADVAALVSQDGCNAVVELGGNSITLVGVSAEDVQNDPSKFFLVV